MTSQMRVIWSRPAKKDLAKLDSLSQKRIQEKLNAIANQNSPHLDIKKLTMPGEYYRLRVGEYRVIFLMQGESRNECYLIAVKRRTTTTYLHEENAPYGCTIYR
ncbi:type II toxin-antitoxin system RelE family toxin [Lelliottia wanjuensis]|uniref:type II toxin-antitoxin system RelE family toxin n=2 Tax=Lelliottia wanjuensis TaxID=3050585 RepID=UPI00254A7C46|nr:MULTISPECIES: type II toxin-antitoxin system RelE/ParE family toxin [unclassified Lelliottia]MDK9602695.1 type II toxin-antitoxin system RelE/ParE family toxin [Lelliottia sp. V106_5]